MRIHAGYARNGITKKTIHTGPDNRGGVLAWLPSAPYCAIKGERVAEICNCEARGLRDEYLTEALRRVSKVGGPLGSCLRYSSSGVRRDVHGGAGSASARRVL